MEILDHIVAFGVRERWFSWDRMEFYAGRDLRAVAVGQATALSVNVPKYLQETNFIGRNPSDVVDTSSKGTELMFRNPSLRLSLSIPHNMKYSSSHVS